MNFVAFDFETANHERHSACSIGLVVVRNNKIVDEFYSLIKPETPFFWRNIQVHGITEEQVENAPKFPEVWQHLKPFFTPEHLVVAHNAPFDAGVLKSTLEYYHEMPPHYMLLDTVRTSRKLYPEFPNHKLNTVCDELGIRLAHHHNAMEDTVACASILLAQEQQFGVEPLKRLVKNV